MANAILEDKSLFDLCYKGRAAAVLATPSAALTTQPIGADAMADDSLPQIEEWRKVPGFPAYEVSNMGSVRNAKARRGTRVGRVLKQGRTNNGYCTVQLWDDYRHVAVLAHRLVAEAFIGPAPSPAHTDVAHNNGNRTDNRVGNLRWATRKENEADKLLHGTHQCGERNHMARFTQDDVNAMRRMRVEGVSVTEIAAIFQTTTGTASRITTGRRWAQGARV